MPVYEYTTTTGTMYMVKISYKKDGKYMQKLKRGFKTKAEAEAAEHVLNAAYKPVEGSQSVLGLLVVFWA